MNTLSIKLQIVIFDNILIELMRLNFLNSKVFQNLKT